MSAAALLAELQQVRRDLATADARLGRIEAMAVGGLDEAKAPTAPTTGHFGLQQPAAFYEHIRGEAGELFPTMNEAQLAGIEMDLKWGAGRCPLSWMAYCLATDYHETNKTMQGVREAYWTSEDWRRKHLRYYPWYGRGKVQLTWEKNYRRASEELKAEGLDVDLIAQPDLALRLDVAAGCLVVGSIEGWYTTKRLRDYLPNPASREHYVQARRIINGTDKADLIAGYAVEFAEALQKGDWR